MQPFSIVSIAFNGYERYVEEFIKKHEHLSDDIVVNTIHKGTMGDMRNRAISHAKHPYVVNIDIDDQLLMAPDVFDDFVGLGWVEGDVSKEYWLPGEARTELNTIRSNFMISREIHDKVPLPSLDFYTYEYLRRLYVEGVSFSKTTNFCVSYDRRGDSLSANTTTDEHEQAWKDLRLLDRTVK